jgi:hypothetical protein
MEPQMNTDAAARHPWACRGCAEDESIQQGPEGKEPRMNTNGHELVLVTDLFLELCRKESAIGTAETSR